MIVDFANESAQTLAYRRLLQAVVLKAVEDIQCASVAELDVRSAMEFILSDRFVHFCDACGINGRTIRLDIQGGTLHRDKIAALLAKARSKDESPAVRRQARSQADKLLKRARLAQSRSMR